MVAEKYILGLMSGSSLDGLDLLLVHFPETKMPLPGQLAFEVKAQATLPYSEDWMMRLQKSTQLSLSELHNTHLAFGSYLAGLCKQFLNSHQPEPDLITLHGHTVYHAPELGFTLQLGDAQTMARELGLPVACDFRDMDIQLGGQGAPLAPTVEHWLFNQHSLFLNLGGIANLSYHQSVKIVGFDIGAANQLLNALANTIQLPFDKDGQLASTGKVQEALLTKAKQNAFFQKSPPKSLSNQWVQQEINSIFLNYAAPIEDKIATACVFIAWQLQHALQQIGSPPDDIMITGGGAFNRFLLEKMQDTIPNELYIPDALIIEQKESLLMALLGYLRLENIPNVISAVTGSNKDHCGGNIYQPF